jgi:FkbM family methyltransferase
MDEWYEQLLDRAYSGKEAGPPMRRGAKKADDRTCFDVAMEALRERRVLLYGAGSFGKEMLQCLSREGVTVEAFLDRNAVEIGSVLGVPVYRHDDPRLDRSLKRDSLVLLSLVVNRPEREEIARLLIKAGFDDIADGQSLRCLLVYADDFGTRDIDRGYLLDHKVKIVDAARLFADDVSTRVYKQNLEAHASRDYAGCTERPLAEQYFPADIALSRGFIRFVDCGGYVGDTLEALVVSQGGAETAVAFEPDRGNFARLSAKVADLGERIGQAFLYPCAVSENTGAASFACNGGSGMLDDEGGETVLSVALDDVLKGFSPSFIKMDIEGGELPALKGAEATICRARPDLAICVYHRINHLWDIPLLLARWGVGYRFYLRSYNACTMETVLYATCED